MKKRVAVNEAKNHRLVRERVREISEMTDREVAAWAASNLLEQQKRLYRKGSIERRTLTEVKRLWISCDREVHPEDYRTIVVDSEGQASIWPNARSSTRTVFEMR